MTLFKCPPRQILEGEPLTYGNGCTITCASTGETLREGDKAVVHIDRHKGSEVWSIIGTYSDCDEAIRACDLHQKDEHDEILAEGRLAVAADCETHEARLIFRDVEVINTNKIED